jgi:hypothetical protein
MEPDVAFRGIRLEIGCGIADLQCHCAASMLMNIPGSDPLPRRLSYKEFRRPRKYPSKDKKILPRGFQGRNRCAAWALNHNNFFVASRSGTRQAVRT